jgi:hypothetical protein
MLTERLLQSEAPQEVVSSVVMLHDDDGRALRRFFSQERLENGIASNPFHTSDAFANGGRAARTGRAQIVLRNEVRDWVLPAERASVW